MSPFRAQPGFTVGVRRTGEQVADLVLAMRPTARPVRTRHRSVSPSMVADITDREASGTAASAWRRQAR
jgi:hypothetical protein